MDPVPSTSGSRDDEDGYDSDGGLSTVSFTPSAQALWFQMRNGNTYLAEDDVYWRPVDHVHSQVEEAWDRWKSATFAPDGLYPPAAADTIKTLLLRKGARILDIGAGRKALWLIAMAVKFPKVEALAVDLIPVEERYVPPNCSFEIYDVSLGLPYPDKHFSLVSHSWLLWYLKRKPYSSLVDEVARVLRPGGVYLLLEPSNEWVCEDGSLMDRKFPAMAKFLDIYRQVSLNRGSGHMEWKDLKFGHILRDSGMFSHVVERVVESRMGPQAPDDPRLNKAGIETLGIAKAGFRAWVPLALGWPEDKALELEAAVQKELKTLEKRNMGDGVTGKVACLWAVRNR